LPSYKTEIEPRTSGLVPTTPSDQKVLQGSVPNAGDNNPTRSQPGSQQGPQPGTQPGFEPGSQPGFLPRSQPGTQTGSQPGSQQGSTNPSTSSTQGLSKKQLSMLDGFNNDLRPKTKSGDKKLSRKELAEKIREGKLKGTGGKVVKNTLQGSLVKNQASGIRTFVDLRVPKKMSTLSALQARKTAVVPAAEPTEDDFVLPSMV
jgi:hypothetical protein